MLSRKIIYLGILGFLTLNACNRVDNDETLNHIEDVIIDFGKKYEASTLGFVYDDINYWDEFSLRTDSCIFLLSNIDTTDLSDTSLVKYQFFSAILPETFQRQEDYLIPGPYMVIEDFSVDEKILLDYFTEQIGISQYTAQNVLIRNAESKLFELFQNDKITDGTKYAIKSYVSFINSVANNQSASDSLSMQLFEMALFAQHPAAVLDSILLHPSEFPAIPFSNPTSSAVYDILSMKKFGDLSLDFCENCTFNSMRKEAINTYINAKKEGDKELIGHFDGNKIEAVIDYLTLKN